MSNTNKTKQSKTKQKINKMQAIINSVIAFTLLLLSISSVFFFIIPNINKAFKLRRQIEAESQEVKALRKKKADLDSYTSQQLDDLYQKTLYFIPENINLGTMGTHINEMAKSYNLKIQRLVLTEEPKSQAIKIPGLSTKSDITLPVKTITAPFIMTGKKQDLLNFINTLTNSLEAQEFDTVQLSKTDHYWVLRLQLTHLYMEYLKDVPLSSTLPTIDKKLVEKLNRELNSQKTLLQNANKQNSTQNVEDNAISPSPTITTTVSITKTQ